MEESNNQYTPVNSLINRLKLVKIAEYSSNISCHNPQNHSQKEKMEPCIQHQPGSI